MPCAWIAKLRLKNINGLYINDANTNLCFQNTNLCVENANLCVENANLCVENANLNFGGYCTPVSAKITLLLKLNTCKKYKWLMMQIRTCVLKMRTCVLKMRTCVLKM